VVELRQVTETLKMHDIVVHTHFIAVLLPLYHNSLSQLRIMIIIETVTILRQRW